MLLLIYVTGEKQINIFLRLQQRDLTSGRAMIWHIYFQQFLEHPWLGFGFGATPEFLKGNPVGSPLNVFIGMLGESGLLGIAPLVVLWLGGAIQALRTISRNIVSKNQRAALGLFVLSILGGMALQQNGEWTIMRVAPMHFLFFFVITVAWRLDRHAIELGNKQADGHPDKQIGDN